MAALVAIARTASKNNRLSGKWKKNTSGGTKKVCTSGHHSSSHPAAWKAETWNRQKTDTQGDMARTEWNRKMLWRYLLRPYLQIFCAYGKVFDLFAAFLSDRISHPFFSELSVCSVGSICYTFVSFTSNFLSLERHFFHVHVFYTLFVVRKSCKNQFPNIKNRKIVRKVERKRGVYVMMLRLDRLFSLFVNWTFFLALVPVRSKFSLFFSVFDREYSDEMTFWNLDAVQVILAPGNGIYKSEANFCGNNISHGDEHIVKVFCQKLAPFGLANEQNRNEMEGTWRML